MVWAFVFLWVVEVALTLVDFTSGFCVWGVYLHCLFELLLDFLGCVCCMFCYWLLVGVCVMNVLVFGCRFVDCLIVFGVFDGLLFVVWCGCYLLL